MKEYSKAFYAMKEAMALSGDSEEMLLTYVALLIA